MRTLGGGAYIVAKDNLEPDGLVAAASLLVDYILTVAFQSPLVWLHHVRAKERVSSFYKTSSILCRVFVVFMRDQSAWCS
jgi:hypothetical protein